MSTQSPTAPQIDPPNPPTEHFETNWNTPDPSAGPDASLSELQLRAIDLLLQCRTDSDVASELHIGRTTLWRWKTQDKAFQTELAHRRHDAWTAASDRYQKLLVKASTILETFLDSHWNPDKMKAAQLLFYMAGRFKPTPPPQPEPAPQPAPGSTRNNDEENDLRQLCNQVLKALQPLQR
jgi:hypothetical protein